MSINAFLEETSLITGWSEKKVLWCMRSTLTYLGLTRFTQIHFQTWGHSEIEKQKRLCIYKLPASGWQSTRDDRSDTLQESCAVQHTSEIQNTTIANIVGQGSLFRTSYLHYIYLSTSSLLTSSMW